MNSRGDQGEHSPGLEAVIQKLEESLLNPDSSAEEKALTVQGDDVDSTATPVPARIRQIITRNLAEGSAVSGAAAAVAAGGEQSVQEENRRLKDLLSQTRLDRDQLLSKQAALTSRLEQMLTVQSGDSDQDSVYGSEQQRLRGESRAYRFKLQAYQDSQQRQAQLVHKLQTKVLQYKKRCGEMEQQVLEKTSELEKLRLSLQSHLDSSAHRLQLSEQEHSLDTQSKLVLLEEERRRCSGLSKVNALLREQLEQANEANQALTESLHQAQEEAEQRDTRLRREQEMSASRLGREQTRIRALWRQAASLRSTFTQLRAFADRNLSNIHGEFANAKQQLHLACMSLQAGMSEHSAPAGLEVSALERQLRDKLREAMQLQGRFDAEKVELNSRIVELADIVKHLRAQNSEKDSSMAALQCSLDRMEGSQAESRAEKDTLRSEISSLQMILHNIRQTVREDGNSSSSGSPGEELPSLVPSVSSTSLSSPQRDNTVIAVQRALSKRQMQTQELQVRLDAALEQAATLRDQLQDGEAERRQLEQRIQQLEQENHHAEKAGEEISRNAQRYRTSLGLVTNEKGELEKHLFVAQHQLNHEHAELERLRTSSVDIQRQRDLLRQQREDLERQLARERSEAERGQRTIEQLEAKHSDVRKELVTVKEALSQLTLQKEVLEDEKGSLEKALSKAETQNAEQELALTKLQSEEAGLRDSLAKMAALSEGLAKDKVELNRVLLQVEAEKVELSERKREAELERTAAREELALVQQELMDVSAEKRALEASHVLLQEARASLDAELTLLQREKSSALEQLAQVSDQKQAALEQLSVCQREAELQTSSLQRTGREREELAKDKASLTVQLTTEQRKAKALAQELAALRAEWESLDSAVFDGQEQISALEADLSRLEGERGSLQQANEVLTREVSRMQSELEQQVSQAHQERQALELKLTQAERNAQRLLTTAQHSHQEQLEAERKDKECVRLVLTAQREQAEEQLRAENEELRLRSRTELQQLQNELAKVQQHCTDSLLQAEGHKQQALSEKEAEKKALTERILTLQREIEMNAMETERMRRDFLSKQEQDKDTAAGLQTELQQLRVHFEESLKSRENSEKRLNEQIRELSLQRHEAQQEVERLQRALVEMEESRDAGRKELIEAHRELRECVQEKEAQRRESLELRRALGNESREKEAIHTSNQELRAAVKRAESDNNSLKRSLEEREQRLVVLEECKSSLQQEALKVRTSMRELEKSHLQARRELQELRRKVKTLEGQCGQREQEVSELQTRLAQEEQREEEGRKESFSLKQRILESDAGREAALKEVAGLQRRVAELEEAQCMEKESQRQRDASLQESQRRQREETSRLEAALQEVQAELREQNVELKLAEGRGRSLEEQLALADASRTDLEHRMSGLTSALRRTLGIGCRARSPTPRPRGRRPSPWRNCSPEKGGECVSGRPAGAVQEHSPVSPVHGEEGQLDVDSVQAALRNFQQDLRDAQRERDDAQTQVLSLKRQLTELQTAQDKGNARTQQLKHSLKELEQGKRDLAARLEGAQASLSLQEEEVRRGDRERKVKEEELSRLKNSLQVSETAARALQEAEGVLGGSGGSGIQDGAEPAYSGGGAAALPDQNC
ncbi:uncharacterized protein crocc2 isoform X4 [Salminus brasiliensis]|uniref:uncharacterized protein crocc2 isoform X4 n=1 Tax=Salminus brasiliensis TaxID=930266 RepID=UPI003B82F2B5